MQGEHHHKELRETKSRLEMETAKKPSMASLDSQGWKSAVQTRMYEEKIKGLETDIEKKVWNFHFIFNLLIIIYYYFTFKFLLGDNCYKMFNLFTLS